MKKQMGRERLARAGNREASETGFLSHAEDAALGKATATARPRQPVQVPWV